MTREMAARRNKFFDDIAGTVAAAAQELGVAHDVAEQLGAAAADKLAVEWKGQILAVPMDHFYRLAKRDLKILADYHAGDTVPTLALRYKMGQRGMYALLARAEARARDRQVAMFPEVEA